MANPQAENGHVDIANDLMEALCRTRIPGEARQVLDAIFRKTYGWHKKSDAIPLSQFVDATGLSKVHVCQALQKLREMNLITEKGNVTEKGNDGIQVYAINKDFDTWRPLPKKVTLPKKVISVTEKGKNSLPNSGTSKETSSKETTKENIYVERFNSFWKAYPKKDGKGYARKVWLKLRPSEDLLQKMLAKIEEAKLSKKWLKDDGEYIPNPATWLNGEGWETEYQPAEAAPQNEGESYAERRLRERREGSV